MEASVGEEAGDGPGGRAGEGRSVARIVSLTPVAIERDTRTYKHAASLARQGYESVVVEGQRSTNLPETLPFRVITSDPGEAVATQVPAAPQPRATSGRDRLVERLRKRFGRLVPRFLVYAYLRLDSWIWRSRQFRHELLKPYAYLRGYLRENDAILDAIPRADLYYLHSYRQFPAVRRKARQTGAPVIYDAHDAYRDITQVPIRGVPTALHLVERRCVREAVARTTTSGGMAARLEARFRREFEVIRNYQDARLSEPSVSDIRADAGVGPDEFLIVMVANYKPGIALESALDALVGLGDDVHLAFLGARYEPHHLLVTDRALEGRVHFLAPVAPTAVSDYIKTADAATVLYRALTPNYVIFLPNGLFYAVSAGLPLIYPRLGEIGATGDLYQLGIAVDPDDAGSLAAAIARLREDGELLSSLRERVRRAQVELSWEHEEQVVARLVGKALAGEPQRAGFRAGRR